MSEIGKSIVRENPDLVILAGDIHTGTQGAKWAREMFGYANFPIIMTSGNHEYYSRKIDTLDAKIRAEIEDMDHIHFLQNQSVTIDGILFSGSTLWTDTNGGQTQPDAQREEQIKMREGMNDYKKIRIAAQGTYRKIKPADTAFAHFTARGFLIETASAKPAGQPWVVITHHAPTMQAFKHHAAAEEEKFPHAAYASNMDKEIEFWNPNIWIHGHIHEPGHYATIGNTQMWNVAMGYPDEQKSHFTIINI